MKINGDTFLISDSHFGHKAVLKREPSRMQSAHLKGYEDFYAFHRDLWNEAVGKRDKVLHLGDLFYAGGFSYLKALNGEKRLLIGNNDTKRYKKLKSLSSWSVVKGLSLQIPEKKYILSALYEKFGESFIKEDIFLNAIVLDYDKERILFSHFPVFHSKPYDRYIKTREVLDMLFRLSDCSLNIHGHLHSRDTNHSFCFNVSCERLGFAPRKLKEVLKLARHKVRIA